MSRELLELFVVLIAVGESYIIVRQYEKIQALQKKIKDAADILRPIVKPRVVEEERKKSFFNLKRQ